MVSATRRAFTRCCFRPPAEAASRYSSGDDAQLTGRTVRHGAETELVLHAGRLALARFPIGLGVTIDEEGVREAHKERHRWRNPIFRLRDGSFAEW